MLTKKNQSFVNGVVTICRYAFYMFCIFTVLTIIACLGIGWAVAGLAF